MGTELFIRGPTLGGQPRWSHWMWADQENERCEEKRSVLREHDRKTRLYARRWKNEKCPNELRIWAWTKDYEHEENHKISI